jgi:hypothetical protein
MRRTLVTATAASALALGAPAAASAHHKRHHKHHSTHARVLLFNSHTVPASPTKTAAPTAPSSEPAGTVTKFEEGVLTITLGDGSVFKGKVTEQTRLECPSSTTGQADPGDDDQGGGDDQSGGDGGEHGGPSVIGGLNRDFQGEDQDANDDDAQQACTTAALVANAKVGEAELVITSAGAVWEKVDLIS